MSGNAELRALVKLIRRLARMLDVQSRRIDRDVGLTLPQLIVLQCVQDLGEVTSRAISLEADLSPPTVVGILDKLEAKGFIRRYRSERDRRIVHTSLTDEGRSILKRIPSILGDSFDGRFLGLPDARRKSVIEGLELIGELGVGTIGAEDMPDI